MRRYLMRASNDDRWWDKQICVNSNEPFFYADTGSFCVNEELRWQTDFLNQCRHYPHHHLLPGVYHQYLLLMNQYYQLTVQNEQSVGFDQFQKTAAVGLREDLELDYFDRFKDTHGSNPRRSRVRFYEGRFAPKEKKTHLQKLLLNILQGYRRFSQGKLH
jgi:hypothetical protein